MHRIPLPLLLALTFAAPGPAYGGGEVRERCVNHSPLREPYFGDLHVHTLFSLDASTQGTRNRPRDAYRFARGHPVGIQPYDADGRALRTVRLTRPLDFVAVTDHAEMLGEREICETPGVPGSGSLICRLYRQWPRAAFFVMNTRASYFEEPERFGFCGKDGARCRTAARGPWQEIVEAAEAAYDRSSTCEFTTFIGYEWTGSPGSNNLHRNVIFRGSEVPALPISHFEAPRPRDLWALLSAECVEDCQALVVPHNSNISGGLMFQTVRPDGAEMDASEAATRSSYEVLVEVMQHKGDSECLPGLGNTDELCAFEKFAWSNFAGRYVSWLAESPPAISFTRNALKEGLRVEERIGVNPFKFGLVAGTDSHLATPGLTEESERFPGHGGAGKPARDAIPEGLSDTLEFNPGGLAVLWAEENSREALFSAMERREAYGTSGPRIVVRLFGGWGYPRDLCEHDSFVERGYASGVPMGGDLPPQPAGLEAPTFAVSALRDPGAEGSPGVDLQRIQIIKGWIESETTRERVYDVAGDPDNGASVDLTNCEPVGRGSAALCTVWTDPDFDPGERSFYYARVVENPTCRWSARTCVAAGVDCERAGDLLEGLRPCCEASHRWTIQERAWTSPIWYTPSR